MCVCVDKRAARQISNNSVTVAPFNMPLTSQLRSTHKHEALLPWRLRGEKQSARDRGPYEERVKSTGRQRERGCAKVKQSEGGQGVRWLPNR